MAGPVPGKVSVLQVADWDSVGSAWNTLVDVGGRVDFNFNLDKTEIDAGHMDIDDGWGAFLDGRKNASISGTVRYIEEDDGQVILVDNAFSDGEEILISFSFDDPAKHEGEETEETVLLAIGFVTNINPSPSDEDVTNMSFTIRVNGEVDEDLLEA